MATLAATTPSPPPTIHTPNTPKLGYADNWEPYSPRKSARISSQRTSLSSSARTPSPMSSRHPRPPQFQITRSSTKNAAVSNNMASPAPSPKKRQRHSMPETETSSSTLTAEGTSNAASFLGPPGGKSDSPSTLGRTTISTQAGMLPTPAKTPSRKHAQQNEANIAAIARNLFHADEETMPNPKQRKPKKYSGFSMASFTAEDVENPIQIFTDSQDKIPEIDASVENPFYGEQPAASVPDPVKRRSKRKTVVIPGEGTATVDGALHRSDGIVYVFRGRRVFRKFEDYPADREGTLEEESPETASSPRLTRSSFKPRLLFPPNASKGSQADRRSNAEDEEADTDIEDHAQSKDPEQQEQQPSTPSDMVDCKTPGTPEAPRFAPASPPGTGRVTRSSHLKLDESTPTMATTKLSSSRGKSAATATARRSPFDGWRRVKSESADSPGSQHGKRAAVEPLPASAVATKRPRC